MNRGVRKVRKSIIQRKKKRGLITTPNKKNVSAKQIMPAFPQEEEKHGYFPGFLDVTAQNKQKSRLISGFILKGFFSIMLFLGAALIWQSDSPAFSKLKNWTGSAFTEEFPFAKVNHWYKETFGSPLGFTPQQKPIPSNGDLLALPVSGSVTETFQSNGTGIMIAPEEQTSVSALREGIIIFAGNDRNTGKTVIIQHVDGSKSTYGYLSSFDVHLYQSIEANQTLGEFDPTDQNNTIYFSIEKDNEYIDPIQVIKVDDKQ